MFWKYFKRIVKYGNGRIKTPHLERKQSLIPLSFPSSLSPPLSPLFPGSSPSRPSTSSLLEPRGSISSFFECFALFPASINTAG